MLQSRTNFKHSCFLPENIGIMLKGVWPLSLLNIYSSQLVALHCVTSLPHNKPNAFTLLDGASTSLQALYMAGNGVTRKKTTQLRILKNINGILQTDKCCPKIGGASFQLLLKTTQTFFCCCAGLSRAAQPPLSDHHSQGPFLPLRSLSPWRQKMLLLQKLIQKKNWCEVKAGLPGQHVGDHDKTAQSQLRLVIPWGCCKWSWSTWCSSIAVALWCECGQSLDGRPLPAPV